jgi:hypothetical protein
MFRIEIGDTTATGITGVAPNQTADYEFFTDEAIQGFIDAYPDSTEEAQSKALSAMGRRLLLLAQDIQVDDIRIKTVERARWFMEHADKLMDSINANSSNGGLVVVGLSPLLPSYRPQGTPYPEIG